MVEIVLPSKNRTKIMVVIVYRRLTGNFFEELASQFDQYLQRFDFTLLMGDFNCHLQTTNPHSEKLRTFLTAYNMHLLPTGPTFHLENYDSWLDLLAINSTYNIVSHSRSDVPFACGHDLLTITVLASITAPQRNSFKCRDWANCNLKELNSVISNKIRDFVACDLQANLEQDVDVIVQTFYNIINDSLDKYAPFIVRTKKSKSLPWVTSELKYRMNERDKLYTIYRSTGKSKFLTEYKAARTAIKKDLIASKINSLQSQQKPQKTTPKNFGH